MRGDDASLPFDVACLERASQRVALEQLAHGSDSAKIVRGDRGDFEAACTLGGDDDLIADLMLLKGFTSAFMFRSERAPEMTTEQRIRGRDAGVHFAMLATGYSPTLMADLAQDELGASSLEGRGASAGTTTSVFQLACLSDAALLDS